MPTTAGDLVNSISRRVRDASNTAHSSAFVLDILDRSQVILNAHRKFQLSTVNLTTVPGQALYTLPGNINGIQRVTEVERDGSRLDELVPWRNLWKLSPTWFTDVGDTLGWGMIGKTLLALWPVPVVATTLQIKGPAITAELTSTNTTMALRDEDSDILRDLVTAMLLFRQRDLDMIEPIVGRMVDKLNLQDREATREEQRNG